MSIKEQLPMNRTSITIVVVVLLCAAGFAYSQGWFNWSSAGTEMESNNVTASQALDQDKTGTKTLQVTQETAEPADTATK
jgi:hypothetical protein